MRGEEEGKGREGRGGRGEERGREWRMRNGGSSTSEDNESIKDDQQPMTVNNVLRKMDHLCHRAEHPVYTPPLSRWF